MSRRKAGNKPPKFNFKLLGLIILLVIIAGGSFYAIGLGLGWWASPFAEPETPTVKTTSTFTGISGVDGEDVSDFLEGSVWIPKSSATFDDKEDIYTLTNFEETKSSMDLEDITIDLRELEYAWLEIDPDGETVFSNDFHLLICGENYDYLIYVYDLTTDVNFNILDEDTMSPITVSDLCMSGGYIAVLDCPHDTETAEQLHVGTNWDMEQSDFDELSATQKAVYYDEKNWAGQYPLYNPTVDLEKEYYSDLEQLTDAFCLKFTFNTTVSTEDGNTAQVNVTIASGQDVECVISGVYIYFIWYSGFDFENGAVSNYFDMDTPAWGTSTIGLDDVDSGRIIVPRDDDALGTFTKYSDIGA